MPDNILDIPDKPFTNATTANIANHAAKTRKVYVNISGQQFVTRSETLLRHSDTKLGRLIQNDPSTTNLFFEGDAEIFKEILKFYITNDLHCPKNICFNDFKNHLEWWGIQTKYISECCSHELVEEQELEEQFRYYETTAAVKDRKGCYGKYSYLIWSFLTNSCSANTRRLKMGANIWMIFYLVVTFVHGMSFVLQTIEDAWGDDEFSTNSSTYSTTITKSKIVISTCEEYANKERSPEQISLSFLSMGICVFYAIEIWIRFAFCPDKRYFLRSINGMDMAISIIETLSYCYFTYFIHWFLPNFDSFTNYDRHCSASSTLELLILVVSQMRFLRLLSYASVYK